MGVCERERDREVETLETGGRFEARKMGPNSVPDMIQRGM